MARRPFEIVYDESVTDHVAVIERKHHSLIEKAIKEQLTFEPQMETKNRKPLLRPSTLGAGWELRIGPENQFRVFYKIDDSLHQVQVLAIGVKEGNKLRIGGKEFDL